MNEEKSKTIPINPLVQDFYRMAEEYDGIDTEDINPSLTDLSQVTQRYQSPELIAEGGMKRIYKVFDARAKRYLALAMLRENAPEDLYDPFIHEAWLTARLDHPNIITIHDVGVKEAKQPYFTMDLKQGVTLRELIEKLHSGDRKTLAQYPLEALLQIFLKICDALSYAHSLNVIHLDLKPANIQIGEYGLVLICDWGLGRVLGDDDPQELDRMLLNPDLLGSTNLYGQFKGTPGYMAPEQLEEDAQVDARADIYGLGSILYSLLTFLRPLTGDHEDVIKRTKDGAIVPPDKRSPERNVPAALNAVVMKALATSPAKRYASVDELREEVNRYLTGFATVAENAGPFKQLSLFFHRNRRFCLTILISLLIVTLGAAWSFHQLSEKERMASEARDQAEKTLALYEAGRSELEKMSFENTESIAALSMRYQFQGNYVRAEAILLAALENEPGNTLILRKLGEHYFIMQEFAKALPFLDRGDYRDDEIHKTTRLYADIVGDTRKVSSKQMVDLIRRIPEHEPLTLRLLLSDQRQRHSLVERAEIIEAYLHYINPDWTDGWFEYDEETSVLRMGGKGLRQVSSQKSVLVGLNPRVLDLSGSEIEGLLHEVHTGIETLDIRGTRMEGLNYLKRFVHLRELIITPGQLPEKELKRLSKQMQVVEKNYP